MIRFHKIITRANNSANSRSHPYGLKSAIGMTLSDIISDYLLRNTPRGNSRHDRESVRTHAVGPDAAIVHSRQCSDRRPEGFCAVGEQLIRVARVTDEMHPTHVCGARAPSKNPAGLGMMKPLSGSGVMSNPLSRGRSSLHMTALMLRAASTFSSIAHIMRV